MSNWSMQHNNTKVALSLNSSFPHTEAGYTVRSHTIATHLLKHGVDLDVYTRPGYPWGMVSRDFPLVMEDIVDTVCYKRLPLIIPDFLFAGELYREAATKQWEHIYRKRNIQIVHTASNYENGYPAIMAAKSVGIKSIYEYRGMWHYTLASRIPWYPEFPAFQRANRLEVEAGEKADAVFAISEALKRDLIEQGIESKKIFVLPNAVDIDRFTPVDPDHALKQSLGLEGRKVVGFIGSIMNYEGLEYMIDAVLECNARGEKVSCLIVGDGKDAPALLKHHAVRGSHPSIIFTGRVPFTDVERYYSIIDIMPFPRINAKVCHCVPPLKPMEAMAMNKTVIVSNVAALQEMVIAEETGLVCEANNPADLANQIQRLLTDETLCRKLADNGTKWVRAERDWANISKRILAVYEELLEA